MINWRKYGEDRSWGDLRPYVGIGLEELRKTTNELSLIGVWAEIRTGKYNIKSKYLTQTTAKKFSIRGVCVILFYS
jgi:hypothetical protein